jgi:integrase
VDTQKKIWTIPAARMKAEADHRVPLSDRALKILEKMDRKSRCVFPGLDAEKLPHEEMLEVLKDDLGRPFTVHGFRSSFKDWASEQTGYANEVSEMALAHKIPGKVEKAYRRGDLFEKRQRLMADWARYCESTAVGAGNVVPLRAEGTA